MRILLLLYFCIEIVAGRFSKDIQYHHPNRLAGHETPRTTTTRFFEDVGNGKPTPEHEKDPEYWYSLAKWEMNKLLEESSYNYNKAKNVIFFLGDGMALNTLTAARIRKGQLKGKTGEEESLSFQRFPHTGLSKTYCTNAQVPDSACTATAYLCGVKTQITSIGVTANVAADNCTMSMDPANHLESIADWAQRAGKSTGFITTTSLTHASPSGLYAKTASRFWECDADIPQEVQRQGPCMDMAEQLITQVPGRNFDIMMGGGMGKFLPRTMADAHGHPGERLDGKNLLQLWKNIHPGGALVTNREELLDLNITQVTKIMGIFASRLMNYHVEANLTLEPTLAEMTETALKSLSFNDKGYFLFVEGGLIDYANHYNKPFIALDETLELEKAIDVALDLTTPEETLIVVSSDHSHPMTIAGYPGRGTDILGLNQHDVDSNGVKYTTLTYAVGPEQYLDENGQRIDLEGIIKEDASFTHPSQIPSSIGTHAGDDVGIFATGPHSHLFRGVMEQHTIPHLMAYAACIGDGPTLCSDH
ncbi:membrane-bound alkaline phosphatase-like [Musca domestica]|uniref:Alkaline phosphatase n=1 Tax=Musca domestica TaxID=7370 RepID=A0A1I8MAQ9_MUSDO|nr:membrane-bound alkaline phosphatase-like [Musca domestica]